MVEVVYATNDDLESWSNAQLVPGEREGSFALQVTHDGAAEYLSFSDGGDWTFTEACHAWESATRRGTDEEGKLVYQPDEHAVGVVHYLQGRPLTASEGRS